MFVLFFVMRSSQIAVELNMAFIRRCVQTLQSTIYCFKLTHLVWRLVPYEIDPETMPMVSRRNSTASPSSSSPLSSNLASAANLIDPSPTSPLNNMVPNQISPQSDITHSVTSPLNPAHMTVDIPTRPLNSETQFYPDDLSRSEIPFFPKLRMLSQIRATVVFICCFYFLQGIVLRKLIRPSISHLYIRQIFEFIIGIIFFV